MKSLIDYIEQLTDSSSFELLTENLIHNMEHNINNFISSNYVHIMNEKYVSICIRYNTDGTIDVITPIEIKIKPQFTKQLELHYPEKLI
jgi:hypothetical protein